MPFEPFGQPTTRPGGGAGGGGKTSGEGALGTIEMEKQNKREGFRIKGV